VTEVPNLTLYATLTRATFVASHMAATAVEAGMVDLSAFGALFLPSGSVIFLLAIRRAFKMMLETRVGRRGIRRGWVIGVARIV